MSAPTPNGGSDETMTREEAREALRHGANMSDADVRAYRSVVMLHNDLDVVRAKLAKTEARSERADDLASVAIEALFSEAAGDDTAHE